LAKQSAVHLLEMTRDATGFRIRHFSEIRNPTDT